jgi:hypothetical protein
MLDKKFVLLIMPIPSETGIDILRISRHFEECRFSLGNVARKAALLFARDEVASEVKSP